MTIWLVTNAMGRQKYVETLEEAVRTRETGDDVIERIEFPGTLKETFFGLINGGLDGEVTREAVPVVREAVA